MAQALALAAEERPFPTLGDAYRLDPARPTPPPCSPRRALVTGDGAIALHVGEDLLWTGDDPAGPSAPRTRIPGGRRPPHRRLVEQFEGATEAVALEVGPGRALVQVRRRPVTGMPTCANSPAACSPSFPSCSTATPARVAEHECAARGGRSCRYLLSWEPTPDETAGPWQGTVTHDAPVPRPAVT